MNSEDNFQPADKSVPIILRNPGKAILLAGGIGLVGGLILGIVFAVLNSTAPASTVEPANAIQRHPTLFVIIVTPLCFGILGLGLGVMSWISTKLQPKNLEDCHTTMKKLLLTVVFVQLLAVICFSQSNMSYKITHVNKDFAISEFDNKVWKQANELTIDKYWSGENAPTDRQFKAKLLWSDSALYVRFEANQNEPLVISDKPNLKTKTRGLWDRDVCEIFLAPYKTEFRKYFEFEIAPTGEWIDLGIYQMPDKRETNFDYVSGMKSAAKVEKNKVWTAIKIEWKAFNKTPQAGEIWLGNILRCVGKDPTRGYLTWQPTFTKEASFSRSRKVWRV